MTDQVLERPAAGVLALAPGDENELRLRGQTEQARSLGIFGAPDCVVRSESGQHELFFGNDRPEQALEWAAAH